MATLYITEYNRMTLDVSGAVVPIGMEPAITTQTVAISGVSAQSALLNSATRFVRIETDTICHLLWAANPTATTSHTRLAASQTEYFGTNPIDVGLGLKIAVIQGS